MTPQAVRRPLDPAAYGIMLALCICWGLQPVAIKLAAPDVATVMQITIRSGFAAAVIGAFIIWRNGLAQFRDGSLPLGIVAGVLFALEFLSIALALNFTYASHASILIYSAPIWAALGLHFRLPEERLSPMQWAGVALAFAGVAVTFLGREPPTGQASNIVLGDLLALLGGASWGFTTVVIRTSRLSEAPAAKTLFYQVAVAAILLLGVALATGATQVTLSTVAVLSLSFQAVIVTLLTFLVWFWMLKRYLASRLGIVAFMTPLFGIGFAVLVLKEPIGLSFGIGALLVLGGIVIVNGAELFGRPAKA